MRLSFLNFETEGLSKNFNYFPCMLITEKILSWDFKNREIRFGISKNLCAFFTSKYDFQYLLLDKLKIKIITNHKNQPDQCTFFYRLVVFFL